MFGKLCRGNILIEIRVLHDRTSAAFIIKKYRCWYWPSWPWITLLVHTHTWIYEYISMNVAYIYHATWTQICQTTPQKRRTGVISLYLKYDELLFSVFGTSRVFLLCRLKTFWLAMHAVHYNSAASLIILCNQTVIPQRPSFNLKPTFPVHFVPHCRHFPGLVSSADSQSACLTCLWLSAAI